jgi:pentatricopeptide repeat protein
VGLFDKQDTVAFVKNRIVGVGVADAERLASEMGRHPLVLELATAYVKATAHRHQGLSAAVAGYIAKYDATGSSILLGMGIQGDYHKEIDTAWQMAMELMRDENPAAWQLANLCAYCAADDIPLAMFVAGREHLPDPLRSALDPGDGDAAWGLADGAVRYSVLHLTSDPGDPPLFFMHRSIQDFTRSGWEQDGDTSWIEHCLSMAGSIQGFEWGVDESIAAFKENVAHMARIAEHSDSALGDNGVQVMVASLFSCIGDWYNVSGMYQLALGFSIKALDILERVRGEGHRDTAACYNNLAIVHSRLGDYGEALGLFEKALTIREAVLGDGHPDTAASYNSLAYVHSRLGDYEKALGLYEKALDICEAVLGDGHPDTANNYNNIAGVHYNLGNYEKALGLFDKALAIREAVLGEGHPDTANSYNNVASVYDTLGDYEKVLGLYERALAIYEAVLGERHPDTATSYNNIAYVHSRLGDYEKALGLYEKALDIREAVLGEGHPDTVQSYNNVAITYYNQGDYTQALEWLLKCFSSNRRRLETDSEEILKMLGILNMLFILSGLPGTFEDWLIERLTDNDEQQE